MKETVEVQRAEFCFSYHLEYLQQCCESGSAERARENLRRLLKRRRQTTAEHRSKRMSNDRKSGRRSSSAKGKEMIPHTCVGVSRAMSDY